MGNDIARQFAHLPADQAVAAISRHIETFWDPRMRDALRSVVSAGDVTLDPLVVAATGLVRDDVARRETDRLQP